MAKAFHLEVYLLVFKSPTLVSPGLWATSSVGDAKFRRLLLALLIVTVVTLVAIVGPASAILMIPSVDWWKFQKLDDLSRSHFTDNEIRIFIGANESTLWLKHISLYNFFPSGCNSTNDAVPAYYCPLEAFPTLLDRASPAILSYADWNISLLVGGSVGPLGAFEIGTELFYYQYLEGSNIYKDITGLAFGSLTQKMPLAAHVLLASLQTEFGAGATESIRWALSLKNNNLIPAPSTYALCSTDIYYWKNGSLTNPNSGPVELLFPLRNGES